MTDPLAFRGLDWGANRRDWMPSKLTAEQRLEIRERYADGETAWALASEYGVTAATVRQYTDARPR